MRSPQNNGGVKTLEYGYYNVGGMKKGVIGVFELIK